MMRAREFAVVSVCGALLLAAAAYAPAKTKTKSHKVAETSAETRIDTWIETWGASQQIPEPQNALPADDLRDATVRQIFHLSVGGTTLRVHLTNAFGFQPLHFTSVHIAKPVSLSSAAIDVATDKALTFSGQNDVTVPPGAEMVSDPIQFPVEALGSVTVSYHLENPPSRETSHPGSRATTYCVHGDQVSAADLPDAKHVEHWYQVTESMSSIALPAPEQLSLSATPSPTAMRPRLTAMIAGPTPSRRISRTRPRHAISPCQIAAPAATICSPTDSGPTRWRASTAMCWRPRASNG